ncbi:MAG: ABC transporter ATP-binding protein [Acidobacteria bacterium]|nr:ABC transporter ATP-binding protein [Acidobacteriota bacterium]
MHQPTAIETTGPIIRLERLTKRFRSGDQLLTVLNEVDLEIAAGESVAILGPSGSGKSTLLALVAGLDNPTSGRVLIAGREIQDLSEDQLALLRRYKIGFVFQSFQLLGNLTAAENVRLPIDLARLDRPEERTTKLLDEVGLGDRGHHYPAQLSGGEQQRVALARAFATRPPILLADEPTGNLDAATGARVLELLDDLKNRRGTTLVLVTHDPAVAAMTDRRLYLEAGRLIDEHPTP